MYIKPEKGDLLISEPFSTDAYFKRTVILITEHNNNGTVGFALNKVYNIDLQDLIGDFSDFQPKLLFGGPVQPNTLHFIYRNHPPIKDSIEVLDGVYWGGDFEQIRQIIQNKGIFKDDILFFMGYSGWGGGQLADEIRENSWIVTPAKASFIFSKENSNLWSVVLKQMDEKYSIMANFPDDPNLN